MFMHTVYSACFATGQLSTRKRKKIVDLSIWSGSTFYTEIIYVYHRLQLPPAIYFCWKINLAAQPEHTDTIISHFIVIEGVHVCNYCIPSLTKDAHLLSQSCPALFLDQRCLRRPRFRGVFQHASRGGASLSPDVKLEGIAARFVGSNWQVLCHLLQHSCTCTKNVSTADLTKRKLWQRLSSCARNRQRSTLRTRTEYSASNDNEQPSINKSQGFEHKTQ